MSTITKADDSGESVIEVSSGPSVVGKVNLFVEPRDKS